MAPTTAKMPAVAVSAAVQGPMLLGFAKPVILLPQRFYGEQELALILRQATLQRAVHRGKWAVTSAFLLPQENPFSLPDFPDSLNFVLLLLAEIRQGCADDGNCGAFGGGSQRMSANREGA